MISLARLEGFYWVARTQGYARAARSFPYPITQPGVHQQVRRLEDEVGTPLFERVGKDRVVLTPAGQVLYAAVAPFYEQLASVVATVKGGAVGGTLRIHAAGMPLRHLLPAWLRRLQAKRPDIDLALQEVRTADLAALRGGEADVLVDYLESVPDDLAVQPIGKAKAFLALPSSHPLASHKHVEVSQLKDEPFIFYSADDRLRALQLRALESHGVVARKGPAADSSETILAFIAAGLGYSLVPALQDGGPRVAGVTVQPLTRPVVHFPIYACWRKSASKHPLVRAALELAPHA